jgi:hypothetical protein
MVAAAGTGFARWISSMALQSRSKNKFSEARRFQRVRATLFGRCMLSSRQESPCVAVEMSPGDMLLFAVVKPTIDEKVVVYLNDFGRFAGIVARLTPNGFAMTLQLSSRKRDKLADQLTWLTNRHSLDLTENRSSERIVPLMQRAIMREVSGQERIVKIRDISLDGVNIETDWPPAVGTEIIVGNTPVVAVRHMESGFAGKFTKPFEVGEIDEATRL